ncbi:ammonia channel protein [Desulforhabdus amnigena]|uniref:Ammonium transporter n=2 Tax=Desulforhabdus amnigena TaxID=40218 RepID=A0A9W6D431_9BACT|nr:ammonia channel protein [Desulforhabdus amnigena]
MLLRCKTALAVDAPSANPADTVWILISSALVMLMLPGLALFYGGMVQTKNVLSSHMHSLVALAVVGILWVLGGYSLSFGTGNAWIGDFSKILLIGISPDSVTGSIPTYAFIMFQGMFAIITPALISGTIAERMKFSTYVVFILLWSLLIYNPVAHWVWGGGWLAKMGVMDFAGGIVVHLTAGVSSLAIVALIGKRQGYPGEQFVPHNLAMTVLGVGLLWFGWFGFNAGSALAANANAALAFTTTMIAGASAATSWMLMEWWLLGKPSALGLASGIVAGLGSITPAAGFVTPAAALFIGLVAGVLCFYGVRMKFKMGYDDSLDVVGVHGVGGVWGPIATGIFATVGGQGFLSGNPGQLQVQVLAVVAVGIYCYVLTYSLAWILDKIMGLRVDEDQEVIGLDRELHGEVGYNL